jgi:hypothetical protein
VSKKNILLTIWLALPITIVSLLMVWIFYSLDKDRLMDDAVPYGAGAGDTGNANAIGEWLAGNNANAISLAVKARREGLAIDPRDWPGGVELRVPFQDIGKAETEWSLDLQSDGETESILVKAGPSADGYYQIVLSQDQIHGVTFWLGDGADSAGEQRFIEPQIPVPSLQTSDPMVVEVRWGPP